jgi:tetratricopeptide (TPR) repeat protein
MSPKSRAGDGSWRDHVPGLAAAAIAVLVYAATLGFDAAYDDQFILRSPLLAHPFDVGAVLRGDFYAHADRVTGLYRPLGQWSLVLNAVLARAVAGSADAWAAYHAVNVLLHAAASFLVYLWVRRLGDAALAHASATAPANADANAHTTTKWIAGCAALLWAVHPTHAEVAANVTARYESLALVFGLGFLLAHRGGPRARAWLAPVLFLAALGCKESAVAFLPLAALADFLFPGERGIVPHRRWRIADWAGSCAALALWLALRAGALAGARTPAVFVENPVAESPVWIRILTSAKVQLLYLRDQALPLWLSTDHSYAHLRAVPSALDPGVLAFAAVALLAVVLAWRGRAKAPAVALCVAGYALLFAPASNFVLPIGTIMADRLAYAPSIFTCLLAASLLARIASPGVRTTAAAVLVAALAVASFRAARAWKDDLTLGFAQVRTAPESAKAHGNLGDALRLAGRFAEAVPEYQRSIDIYPYRPKPYQGLAQCRDFLGEDPERSVVAWLRSIRFGTLGGEPDVEAALDAADVGDWSAFDACRARMTEAAPDDWRLLSAAGARAAAERLLREPKDGADWTRGEELLRRGSWTDAEASLLRAVHGRDVPDGKLAETLLDLARCNEKLGKTPRAERFRRLAAKTTG